MNEPVSIWHACARVTPLDVPATVNSFAYTSMGDRPWISRRGSADLGLARYERRFRECAVDTDVLADLTEADLEELGISLRHRKKLLEAIAALTPQEFPGR